MDKIEIFVGEESPSAVKGRAKAMARAFVEASGGQSGPSEEDLFRAAHPLSQEDFVWPPNVRVVWPGTDSSRCAAAINPEPASAEFGRFLAGAERRGETALVLTELCREGSTEWVEVSTQPDSLGDLMGKVLPPGVRPELGTDLPQAEHDLALRIRNTQTQGAPWFAISVHRKHGFPGELKSILADDLGEPVAAVWIPDEVNMRSYLFPCASSWESILGWLVDQAIPEYVPEAAARTRSDLIDDRFLTPMERDSGEALRVFEERVKGERATFAAQIEKARGEAERLRQPLLYGSGETLKEAVSEVLSGCGLPIEDLDRTFGSGRSGDLLLANEDRFWLVEIKGVSGSPGENTVYDVVKHVRTWPNLDRGEKLEGGILLVNHNSRLTPATRPSAPFRRREFVSSMDSLGVTVISTVQLCEWWASADCVRIVGALTGPHQQYPGLD